MQMANVKIKFETFNEFNFLMDLAGNDGGAISGLLLLQEELPAEISFHVPETYHKRIIGVGGRSIQRIMKKYGVYVKFSNAEEFAALGGYGDNEDNVIARTPAKNAINLDNLKQAVMELVHPKVLEFPCSSGGVSYKFILGQGLCDRVGLDPETIPPHLVGRKKHFHQGHREQDQLESPVPRQRVRV